MVKVSIGMRSKWRAAVAFSSLSIIVLSCGQPAVGAGVTATHVAMSRTTYAWWRSLSVGAKEAALQSAIAASTFEWLEAYGMGRSDAEVVLERDPSTRYLAREIDGQPLREGEIFSHNLRFYREQIDLAYARSRLLRTYGPLRVLSCLADIPSQSCPGIPRNRR